MEKEGWKELFRVEEATEKKEVKTQVHVHYDNGRCLRAKGFKCVCKCCGEHHGALSRQGMSPLETYTKEPTIDTSEIEHIFAGSMTRLKGPIEFSRPVVRGLL